MRSRDVASKKTPLLTRQEAADRLGVHRTTTYGLQGFPTPILKQGATRFHPDDVGHYIATRKAAK